MDHRRREDRMGSSEHINRSHQNEDVSRHYLPEEDFLPDEIEDEIPETFTRRRPPKKKTPLIGVLVIIFVVVMIVFAFYWESARREEQQKQAELRKEEMSELPPNFPPPGRSAVQDKLNDFYMIEQDFLPINRYSRSGSLIAKVNGIVIHNIGNPNTTAQQNRNYFASLAQTHERHASAHFIICLDGAILQCVPVDEEAYASNQRNFDTLSIELCHPDETGEFTAETYNAAVFLTAWLSIEFGLTPEGIIRHSEIANTECPRYFTNDEEAWEAFKAAVLAEIKNLRS